MTSSKTRSRLFSFLAVGFATILGLLFSEAGLRGIEWATPMKFRALSDPFAENFFFAHWKPGERLYPSAELFDPLLGWHAGGGHEQATINAQGWRNPQPYRYEKEKTRILLLGDSYTFGSNLSDAQTIAAQLQGFLGSHYEVMSMAASGFAVDQMAIAATELAPRYHPDVVILAFIAHDLERSCLSFAWGQASKPYFVREGNTVSLRGTPVLSPEENAKRHQAREQWLKDRAVALLLRIRVLNLLASPILHREREFCLAELNARILDKVHARLGASTRLLFMHLDGDLPSGFVQAMHQRHLSFESWSQIEPGLALRLGGTPGTVDGFHPNADRARLIASHYRDFVLSRAIASEAK